MPPVALTVTDVVPPLHIIVPGVAETFIVVTVSVAGFEFTEPEVLVQTARYWLPSSPDVAVKVNVAEVAPLILFHVLPSEFTCH